ncbi:hypothetical protein [Rhodohalobacter sp.]|uniref:hypothetical protein n=1 Tax=Rhodohalobacter sp. TaxID=1974210 RepID=UPI0039763A13
MRSYLSVSILFNLNDTKIEDIDGITQKSLEKAWGRETAEGKSETGEREPKTQSLKTRTRTLYHSQTLPEIPNTKLCPLHPAASCSQTKPFRAVYRRFV